MKRAPSARFALSSSFRFDDDRFVDVLNSNGMTDDVDQL